MSSSVEYDSELRIVRSVYAGRVTAEEFKDGTAKAIGLARENNTHLFFIDDSEWEGGASTVGLYDLPAVHSELKADRASRAALLLPPSGSAAERDARFYETVCHNRGWQVRVFSDREEALNWLTGA